MDEWMGGWLAGWLAGWMDGWLAGWMDGWMDEWMGVWLRNKSMLRRSRQHATPEAVSTSAAPAAVHSWPEMAARKT